MKLLKKIGLMLFLSIFLIILANCKYKNGHSEAIVNKKLMEEKEMDLTDEMAYQSVIKKYNKYFVKREYKNAVDILLTVKDKCKNNFSWHLAMGTALAFMGKDYLEQADNEFDKAIELAGEMGRGSEKIIEMVQKLKKELEAKNLKKTGGNKWSMGEHLLSC